MDYNVGRYKRWRKTVYTCLRGRMDLFDKPSIVNEIKQSKLEWAKSVPKNPSSKSQLGRPRLRWEYGIRKDFLNARG